MLSQKASCVLNQIFTLVHQTILSIFIHLLATMHIVVLFWTVSIQMHELEIMDVTSTPKSSAYIDIFFLKIGAQDRLRFKLYDKQDDFIFPIVYFPFICSNIPYFVSGPVLNQKINKSSICDSYYVDIIVLFFMLIWLFETIDFPIVFYINAIFVCFRVKFE